MPIATLGSVRRAKNQSLVDVYPTKEEDGRPNVTRFFRRGVRRRCMTEYLLSSKAGVARSAVRGAWNFASVICFLLSYVLPFFSLCNLLDVIANTDFYFQLDFSFPPLFKMAKENKKTCNNSILSVNFNASNLKKQEKKEERKKKKMDLACTKKRSWEDLRWQKVKNQFVTRRCRFEDITRSQSAI